MLYAYYDRRPGAPFADFGDAMRADVGYAPEGGNYLALKDSLIKILTNG